MQKGDDVLLEDANGTKYTYQVSKVFSVSPQENWVTAPIAGRDMVTLQTCTETLNDWWTIGPNLMSSSPDTGRLIVQADRVDVKPA
jgi:sortase A